MKTVLPAAVCSSSIRLVTYAEGDEYIKAQDQLAASAVLAGADYHTGYNKARVAVAWNELSKHESMRSPFED